MQHYRRRMRLTTTEIRARKVIRKHKNIYSKLKHGIIFLAIDRKTGYSTNRYFRILGTKDVSKSEIMIMFEPYKMFKKIYVRMD